MSQEKTTFTRQECFDQVRAMARLFGLMFYHFANLLVENLGDEKSRVRS